MIAFSRTRWFRLPFGGLLGLFAIWAVFSEWSEVRTAVAPAGRALDGAGRAGHGDQCGPGRDGMADRAGRPGLRLRLPVAGRIFFVGQLGKYLPGSVWPVVMQAELGRDHHIPRRRTMTVSLVAQLLSFATALLVAVLVLPLAPDALPDASTGPRSW